MDTVLLRLDQVKLDGGTQARESIDESVVAEYAENVESLPRPVVFFDGSEYWLADGFHRYHAYRKAGIVGAEFVVRTGTRREAILYSVGANAEHGLRRSNADKRRAVETLLEDAEWSGWSDREIAKMCRVSHPFVASLRPRRDDSSGNVTRCADETRKFVRNEKVQEQRVEKKPAPPPPIPAMTPFEAAKSQSHLFSNILGMLDEANRQVAALAENKLAGHFVRHQQFLDALKNARRVVKFAEPASACPYMPNCKSGKCKCCKGAGWIPSDIHDKLNAEERAMLEGNG